MIDKIFRSLPLCFDLKVTTVEESKDVKLLDIDELVKSIALKTTKNEKEMVCEESSEEESSNSEPIAMLIRNFQKYLKNAKQISIKPTEWYMKGESQKDLGINPTRQKKINKKPYLPSLF